MIRLLASPSCHGHIVKDSISEIIWLVERMATDRVILRPQFVLALKYEFVLWVQGMLTPLSGTETSSRGRELSRLRASSGAASPAPAWLGRDGSNAAAHLAAWRSRRGFALDITAFDGADILSSKV